MKNRTIGVLVTLVSLGLGDTFGQVGIGRKEALFQVIFAENVFTRKGGTVESLDHLYEGDTILVDKSGTIAMVHWTNFPVEISGDSTIVVSSLANLIDAGVPQILFNCRKLDLLFIASKSELSRRQSEFGLVRDLNHNFEIFYPPQERFDIGHDLCIYWRPTKDKYYRIEIQNFYGDVLTTINTTDSEIRFTSNDLSKITHDSSAILKIQSENRKASSKEYLLTKFSSKLNLPYRCNPDKASYALITALNMEFSQRPYIDGAEKFYELAATLSESLFYDKMLRNFRKRRGR